MIGAGNRPLRTRAGNPPHGLRVALTLCMLCALCLALNSWAVPGARADGGAPNLVYVAGTGARGQDVSIVDIAGRRVTASVATDSPAAGIVLSVDGRFAYLTQPAHNRVAVLDTSAKKIVATIPVGPRPDAIILVPTAAVTELFVALEGGDAVAVIDADARRVLRTIQVGSQPVGISLAGTNSGIADPNDPEVYVACAGSRSVAVIETAQNQVVATLQLAASPTSVVVPASGGAAYVTSVAGTIEAISVADHSYLGVVYQQSGARFGTMDYDAITGQIYAPDAASGVVDVLAPISVGGEGGATSFPHEPARVLGASGAPSAVAITFDGSYGFVARRAAGSVVMLDPASHRELATIAVGGAPAALVTGPYPPAVSGQTAFLIDIAVIALLIAFMGFAVVSAALSARRRKTGQRTPPRTV